MRGKDPRLGLPIAAGPWGIVLLILLVTPVPRVERVIPYDNRLAAGVLAN